MITKKEQGLAIAAIFGIMGTLFLFAPDNHEAPVAYTIAVVSMYSVAAFGLLYAWINRK